LRLLALVALILASPAWAQALSKPVRMIVPFPAGGGTRLAEAIVAAARSDDAAENVRKFGMRAQTSGPAAFAATLKADLDRWAPIVKASGFTAED
jgi:tripartite-type tricarboxylate transporter receptor subunit TctC